MRIGLVEFLLLFAIASLTVGPQVALFVDRWLRRANRANARAARRRAEYAAQMAQEREALLKRFRTASTVFGVCVLLALVYALVFRPIDTPPEVYSAPAAPAGENVPTLTVEQKSAAQLDGYQGVDCIRRKDGLTYAAAYRGSALKKRKSDLVRTDGSNATAILTVDGELTGFAFDAAGDLWLTVLTPTGGTLCRAGHDSWGTAVEQVVTQIDGAPLGAVSAVEVGADGKVYFAVATGASAENGLKSALSTELIAHTGTGCVYVYDPRARSVQKVLGGVAGASALALDADGQTLYVADLGSRCIWAVDADARELTAGGRDCTLFAQELPGYPGTIAVDTDGSVYVGCRWTRCGWLEDHADGTLLRGMALRVSQSMQERLLPMDGDTAVLCCYGTDGSCRTAAAAGKTGGGVTAVCPDGSKLYFAAAGSSRIRNANL